MVIAGYAVIVAAGECDCTEADLIAAADGLRAIGVTVAAISLGGTSTASLQAFASIGADGTPLVFANQDNTDPNAEAPLVSELNRAFAGIGALVSSSLMIHATVHVGVEVLPPDPGGFPHSILA